MSERRGSGGDRDRLRGADRNHHPPHLAHCVPGAKEEG